jgi:hypothetical protein
VRVFVLTSGRTGSVTFARACSHMTNYTVGHETRAAAHGAARFAYPDNHIEVDNRLSWFVGPLAEHHPDARYVHLLRDTEATARSFLARWNVHPPPPRPRGRVARLQWQMQVRNPRASLISAFANGLLMRGKPWPPHKRIEVSRFLVETVHANLRTFLADRPHVVVRLETAAQDFAEFWEWVGAEGDLDAALSEWQVRHNARH